MASLSAADCEVQTSLCQYVTGTDDDEYTTTTNSTSTSGSILLRPASLIWECISRDESDFLFNEIFTENVYFKHGISLATVDGSESPIVVDCGANIGLFTLYCNFINPAVRSIAIEPIPCICNVLARNLHHNRVRHEIIRCALGSSIESSSSLSPVTTTLSYMPNMPGESSRHAEEQFMRLDAVKSAFVEYAASTRLTETHTVELETCGLNQEERVGVEGEELSVQELLESLNYGVPVPTVCPLKCLSDILNDCIPFISSEGSSLDIDLLKIDVEGSELLVLQGLDGEWWPRIRQVAIEVFDIDNRLQKVVDLLRLHFTSVHIESPLQQPHLDSCDMTYFAFTPSSSKLHYVYAT